MRASTKQKSNARVNQTDGSNRSHHSFQDLMQINLES